GAVDVAGQLGAGLGVAEDGARADAPDEVDHPPLVVVVARRAVDVVLAAEGAVERLLGPLPQRHPARVLAPVVERGIADPPAGPAEAAQLDRLAPVLGAEVVADDQRLAGGTA